MPWVILRIAFMSLAAVFVGGWCDPAGWEFVAVGMLVEYLYARLNAKE